jgi:aquaglyceroporin related protein, other eukaryote
MKASMMNGSVTQIENSGIRTFSSTDVVPKDYLKEESQSENIRKTPHQEHGILIDQHIVDKDAESYPDLMWSRIRRYMKDPFSEFFGVFILILFGDGSVAQVVLSGDVKGAYQSISWGWG